MQLEGILLVIYRSAIAISIQRAAEFGFKSVNENVYDPFTNPFLEKSFIGFITGISLIINLAMTFTGECGYSREASGLVSSTGYFCQSDKDCMTSVSCFIWENFFGYIHYDSRGINVGGKYIIGQIYNNR